MIPSVPYGGCGLDRASTLRADPVWLEERRRDPSSRILPVRAGASLVAGSDPPRAATLPNDPSQRLLDDAAAAPLLGLDDAGRAHFALAVEADAPFACGDGLRFEELRRISAALPAADAALLAYARGMVHWLRRHRRCGGCGAPTVARNGGHVLACGDAGCGLEHFPRTDPAVIVLVTRGRPGEDACLLARQPGWPRGLMSTLAGFVEPGESVEEAVAREVGEETGLVLETLRYFGSQPWPFPSQLMLAFRARASDDAEITLDADELEDGRWFTRSQIADPRGSGIRLPTRDSIARAMIEEWLAEA